LRLKKTVKPLGLKKSRNSRSINVSFLLVMAFEFSQIAKIKLEIENSEAGYSHRAE